MNANKYSLLRVYFLKPGEAKRMLDAMATFMAGQPEYDPEFFSELTSCFDKLNPLILPSQVKPINLCKDKKVIRMFLIRIWDGQNS